MRKFAVLLVLLVVVTDVAWTQRRVSVAQLQEMVAASKNAHKSDVALAKELAGLEMTEELTAPTLAQLTAQLQAGSKAKQALDLLADASALLAPPASELPSTYQPDPAMQRAILAGAVSFVVKTMKHMPDFLATRTTRSFDDSPFVVGHFGYAPVTDMHPVGTFSRTITYRSGLEVTDAAPVAVAGKPRQAAGPAGLSTSGEFGPVLATVLSDASKGIITWARWEPMDGGKAGVFHYEVPKAASHYEVDYCCAWNALDSGNPIAYHGTPGYHGELFVDPASGAVLRVTLEAEMGNNDVISHAAISVQYGKVDIGGSSYVCPVRSVALSEAFDRQGKTIGGPTPVKRINEVTFTGYHRFGSTSRILAGASERDAGPGTPEVQTAEPSAASVQTATDKQTPANSAENSAAVAAAPVVVAAPQEATAAATPSAAQKAEEATMDSPMVLKTTSRAVVVDVVVTKGSDEPVLGLSKPEFTVLEDGKPQAIDFFEEHAGTMETPTVHPQMPSLPPGMRTNVPPAPLTDAVNVLLLDSLNTPRQDQIRVHQQMLQFFNRMKPGTRMAIFTLGSKLRFVQGFTTDAAVLLAALNDKRNNLDPQKDDSLYDRDDAADDKADAARLASMLMGHSDEGIAARESSQGEFGSFEVGRRTSMTFEALNYLAQYLAGIPGRKNLIWFSSTFPVVIFPNFGQRDQLARQPGYIGEVNKTADLLTLSKVAVYPVSAEGTMDEHVLDADMAGPSSPEGAGHFGTGDTMQPYMAGAAERADTMSAMEQIAADTGGKAYFNTNDLNGALLRAVNDGSNYYTIGYSPTNPKMDGTYRKIEVKVDSKRLKLAYRRGYNADDLPKIATKEGLDPLAPSLMLGMPGATGILYGATAQPETTQPAAGEQRAGQNTTLKDPVTRYIVDLVIRPEDLAFEENAQGARRSKILIDMKAYDRDGHALNWVGNIEDLHLTADEFAQVQKTGIPVQVEIDLPAKTEMHLVTGVYDWSNGKMGTLDIPIHPEAPIHP